MLELIFEPGEQLWQMRGWLLTKSSLIQNRGPRKKLCYVIAAMNDLIRDRLYTLLAEYYPLSNKPSTEPAVMMCRPVCETSDFLGKERELSIAAGDFFSR